jgi:hypothetical protein
VGADTAGMSADLDLTQPHAIHIVDVDEEVVERA